LRKHSNSTDEVGGLFIPRLYDMMRSRNNGADIRLSMNDPPTFSSVGFDIAHGIHRTEPVTNTTALVD